MSRSGAAKSVSLLQPFTATVSFNNNSLLTVGITKYWNRCICILTGTEGAIECQEQVAFWRVVFYSSGVYRYHLGLSVKQLKQVFHACALVSLLQRIRSTQGGDRG